MNKFYSSRQFIIGALLVLGVALPVNNRKFGKVSKNEDIYYIYQDAKTVSEGINPYARTLDGNMKDNDKYSTYFPLFYELGALAILVGFEDFETWLMFWQVFMLLFLAGCGFLIFRMVNDQADLLLAIFSVLFFFFHRWIINISVIGHIDLIAAFFLLLSLFYLNKNFKKALLWFGVSLAIKQIAIFMAPLYLVWAWHNKPSWKFLGQSTLLAAAIPLAASLPYLIWNFKAFLYSVFFSATRKPDANFDAKSLDALFNISGLVAKLPMLILVAFVCVLAFKKKLPPYISAFLIMSVFIGFNSVFYRQYFAWPIVLLPLVFIDIYQFSPAKKLG
ncbi:MAG: hypothetical protein KDC92_08400 [Bacteroidetes bacterium]|nr:hypothetical protein [Bacteroidota bacterium]